MFSPDIVANGIAAACAHHNIPILAYSPIGRGVKEVGMLAEFPRMQQEEFEHNLKLVRQVEAMAKKKGCTPAQLALNWMRGLSNRPGLPTIIPILGATTAARVKRNAKVFKLSDEEMKTLGDMIEQIQGLRSSIPYAHPYGDLETGV